MIQQNLTGIYLKLFWTMDWKFKESIILPVKTNEFIQTFANYIIVLSKNGVIGSYRWNLRHL